LQTWLLARAGYLKGAGILDEISGQHRRRNAPRLYCCDVSVTNRRCRRRFRACGRQTHVASAKAARR